MGVQTRSLHVLPYYNFSAVSLYEGFFVSYIFSLIFFFISSGDGQDRHKEDEKEVVALVVPSTQPAKPRGLAALIREKTRRAALMAEADMSSARKEAYPSAAPKKGNHGNTVNGAAAGEGGKGARRKNGKVGPSAACEQVKDDRHEKLFPAKVIFKNRKI